MARKLDPVIAGVLKEHGFGADACWDCHGTWVVYHRVLEQIATKASIAFDSPLILEANGEKKVAAICVTGHMGDKSEWSIGEAAPGNNKNAYPWAMAEKRGKDRVILKLIGLHGFAYSEEEADDFKRVESDQNPDKDGAGKYIMTGPLTKTALQNKIKEFCADVALAEDMDMLAGVMEGYKEAVDQCKVDWPQLWEGIPEKEWVGAGERYDAKWKELVEQG